MNSIIEVEFALARDAVQKERVDQNVMFFGESGVNRIEFCREGLAVTRMSREFSLVLLGAGILGAGYFAAPSPDEELEKKAEEQAAQRVHAQGSSGHRMHGHIPLLLWVHSPRFAGGATGGRSPAMGGVARGGFGGIGHTAAGG